MARLVILVGIPGCGKSTWAEHMFDPHYSVTVSSDRIRAELSDVNDQTRNSEVFDLFHQRIAIALEDGETVIADSTALDARARRNLLDVASQVGVDGVHLVYFSNCDQAVMRNSRRERKVPEDVMVRMLDKYEYFKVVLPQEAHQYTSVTEIRSTR